MVESAGLMVILTPDHSTPRIVIHPTKPPSAFSPKLEFDCLLGAGTQHSARCHQPRQMHTQMSLVLDALSIGPLAQLAGKRLALGTNNCESFRDYGFGLLCHQGPIVFTG
jgi:hypothetical protein